MRRRRQVQIQVGAHRAPPQQSRPRTVLLGVRDWASPRLVDALPQCRVRDSRYDAHELGVEHLRIPIGTHLAALPGLDGAAPSLLRDAAMLAFSTGVPHVDLLVARTKGAVPWDLARPEVVDLLGRALGELPGVTVALPDAAGPTPLGSHAEAPDPSGLIAAVEAYGPVFSEHYQLGCVHLPELPERTLFEVLQKIRHHDVCATTWVGGEADRQRHGWRAGDAFFAARIAQCDSPMATATGYDLPLVGGRARVPTRFRRLGGIEPVRALPWFAEEALVSLSLDGDRVHIGAEPTLRAPVGLWDVPLMRTAKILHHRIAITANLFVFEHVNETTAMMFQTALNMALADFAKREVVSGPEDGPPMVHAIPHRDPLQPALIATVRAFLKPWMRELRIDLAVRPGQAAVVEVA